jgi:hypothetical protein
MTLADRELLEREALAEVCSCQYYDLADTLHETPDDDLLSIVHHTRKCKICGK